MPHHLLSCTFHVPFSPQVRRLGVGKLVSSHAKYDLDMHYIYAIIIAKSCLERRGKCNPHIEVQEKKAQIQASRSDF